MIDAWRSRARQELYPAAFKAYDFALEYLDRHDWRPMKVELVMLGCRMEKATAIRAMRTLVKRQYLARRGGGPQPYQYRLLPPPLPQVKAHAA